MTRSTTLAAAALAAALVAGCAQQQAGEPGSGAARGPDRPAPRVIPGPGDAPAADIQIAADAEPAAVGQPAPVFQATALTGERLDLADYLGERPVLLNFFSIY